MLHESLLQRAVILDDSLDTNRKKKGYILGFRTLFDETVKNGDMGFFYPFGSVLPELAQKEIRYHVAPHPIISLNTKGEILPSTMRGSQTEGVFVTNREIQTGKARLSQYSIFEPTVNYFDNDLRNRLLEIPLSATVYIVEKLEGVNVDISFSKSMFGTWKYKIDSDYDHEKLLPILKGIFLDERGKVFITPLEGEIFHLKLVGRGFDNVPLKRVELSDKAHLRSTRGKNLAFDYGFKTAEVYLSSIERKISAKETLQYTWKTIQHRAKMLKLRTSPQLRETSCENHYKLLQECIGLTERNSALNKNQFIKGINLFVEHEDMIARIPYYSFSYINSYYYSYYTYRTTFDLGL